MTPAQPLPKVGRDDRRDAILRIAHDIFLKNGYAATSMSAIAALVGGSKATLYAYFPSKEELFAAVVGEKCEDMLNVIFESEQDTGDFKSVLSHMAERITRLMLREDNIATYRLITAEAGRFPELGCAFYRSGPRKGREMMGGIFARAVEQGQLKAGDSVEMAQVFFDLCKGDLRDRKLWNVSDGPTDADIEASAARAVRVFLAAYSADSR
jgi:AcrR family transcriptional regulator